MAEDRVGELEAISAVTLVTADMAAAVSFYRALGFELVYGDGDAEFTSLKAGTCFLNLQLDATAVATAQHWGRIVFWVDDVDAMHRRALDARLTPEFAPTDAPWGERYFHIRDPHGHELSFARLL